MKKHLGSLGLLLTAIIWGSGFVANNIALETMTPLQVLCIRFFIGAVLMGAIAFKRFKGIRKQEIIAGTILGIILFTAFVAQTFGLKYTTPSKNAFLTATNVVIVPFIAFLLNKKKVDRYSSAGAVMAITGIGILSLRGNLSLSFGDALTLLCALCFAFHIFYTGEFAQKYDVLVLTAIQMLVAFLLSFIVILPVEGINFSVSGNGLISVIYLGVFSTTIAFFLQTVAQKYTTETKAAVILSMESVFGTLFSILIVHERITLKMVAGCLLILAAVIIAETKPKFIRK
ncbi:DMT family transporter [Anaerocolumna xylanovorans]|uniref:EamA-like transporter family protein n=1 Tax=Anaerocolumna xylanovorans DSM 12503 TaxID=1121345 RepID=A0A1M7YEV6_9FIRM|nr:DMT family transporter [Anaerocolumna xylanovorans]SHO51174.1 EamA-like transporter family protein [Anaerocolumna xylanovorans DSM 12503]